MWRKGTPCCCLLLALIFNLLFFDLHPHRTHTLFFFSFTLSPLRLEEIAEEEEEANESSLNETSGAAGASSVGGPVGVGVLADSSAGDWPLDVVQLLLDVARQTTLSGSKYRHRMEILPAMKVCTVCLTQLFALKCLPSTNEWRSFPLYIYTGSCAL